MIVPQFSKRQVVFLGLGTLLPACFLLLALLDTRTNTTQQTKPRPAPSMASSLPRVALFRKDDYSQVIDGQIQASANQLVATINNATIDTTSNTFSLDVHDLATNTSATVRGSATTFVVRRPLSQNSAYQTAAIKDLSAKQQITAYGTLKAQVLTAKVVVLNDAQYPIFGPSVTPLLVKDLKNATVSATPIGRISP